MDYQTLNIYNLGLHKKCSLVAILDGDGNNDEKDKAVLSYIEHNDIKNRHVQCAKTLKSKDAKVIRLINSWQQ